MYNYQWFFQGTVQRIIDGRTLDVSINLGFHVWKIIPIKFNRLRIFVPNERLYYFLNENLKGKKIYLNTIKNRDRFGSEKFFAEIFIDSEIFPIAEDKEELLSLRVLNRTLATGVRPITNKTEELININDFLVKQGLAEYVESPQIPLCNRPPRGPEEISDGTEDGQKTKDANNSSWGRSPSERSGSYSNSEGVHPRIFKRILPRVQG
jgi:hypothetical protein